MGSGNCDNRSSERFALNALSLNLGEQAALSLLHDHPQAMLLTDDAAARVAATTMGYRVHGTIRVLIRAIRRQQLTKDHVMSLLRQLPSPSTVHIRPALLQEIMTRRARSWISIVGLRYPIRQLIFHPMVKVPMI
jgi:predicted nucleic acid-binding protein